MTWPLGYGKPSFRFRSSLDGVLFANDVAVTEVNGWLEVRLPATASVRGAPAEISIRVRLGADAEGHPMLYAEQAELGGRRYAGIHSLLAAEGMGWINTVTRAVHDEIVRRVRHAESVDPREKERATTRPVRAVTTRATGALRDDSWNTPPAAAAASRGWP